MLDNPDPGRDPSSQAPRETDLGSSRLPSLEAERSLQLLFDEAFSTRVDELRSWLAAEGIVRSVDACPPHLTLAVGLSAPEGGDYSRALRAAEEGLSGATIRFGSLGLFSSPDGFVVFLAPVPSARLLEAHAAAFGELGAEARSLEEHYRPGSFVPHVTIGSGISAQDLSRVLARCAESLDLPCEASVTGVGVFVDGAPIQAR